MKHDELKEIFLSEAFDNHEELNRLFTELEKNSSNKETVNAIFRITHTLKANAAGMGFEGIAELAHVLEDIFSEVKTSKISIDAKLFADLYKACDIVGLLIQEVKAPLAEPVKFKGLKTKLEVVLRNARSDKQAQPVPVLPIQEEKVDKTVEQEIATASASKTTGRKEKKAKIEESSLPEENSEPESNELLRDNKISFSDLVQIPVRKLDNLLNLVGELIIERDRVIAINSEKKTNTRNNEYNRLQRITSELQYSVMDVRLVQVNVLFNKFHRIVRDTAAIESKQVNLVLEGTEIEIDRSILQIISDSLIHLVRNAISHGIESPADRIAKGKKQTGTIKLTAKGEKDSVLIEVTDDGKGIDSAVIRRKAIEKGIVSSDTARLMSEKEIISLIFEPGFSSAEKITEVSGRGVGMDVVKRAMDSIGGRIDIETEVGKGSSFLLHVPSSMAVKGALLFGLSNQEYAIPLSYTEGVVQLYKKDVHKIGRGLMANYQGQNLSLLFLNDLFEADRLESLSKERVFQRSIDQVTDDQKLYVVLVSCHNRKIGLVVDYVLQQKEIVEKPLHKPLDNISFVSGATILGNGHVCLVVDIPSIANFLFSTRQAKQL